jgi:acyl carrier protein
MPTYRDMTYRDILTQTCELLEPFAKGRRLEEETDLLTHVGLDSLQAMEVLLAAEGRFDMSIPLNVLAEVRTVGDLAEQLQQLIERR